MEAQLSGCSACREELEKLRPMVGSFVSWPTDILRPSTSLWERLAVRIAGDSGNDPIVTPSRPLPDAEWEEAAPGIFVKLLSTDSENDRVSMLVRLAP